MIDRLHTHRQAVDEELRAVFEGRQGFLYDVLRYHMGWVDQQGIPVDAPFVLHFQPRLSLLSCEAVSGDFHPALPAAAAVELVHNFTLVHGDVQSNRSAGKPGSEDRPSIWWVWGPAQAINAGDGLHALGRTTIMRLAQRNVPPQHILSAMQSLDRACLTTCEGQYMDLEFQAPTGKAVVWALCRNTLIRTMGLAGKKDPIAVAWWQRLTAHFCDLGKLRFAKRD